MGKVKIYNLASAHKCNDFLFLSEFIFTVKITAPRNYSMRLTYYSASHKSNPLSVPRGIVDSYSTLLWVMWGAVTVVEGIP